MKKTFFALSMCAVLMCAASARATLIDFNIHHDGSAQSRHDDASDDRLSEALEDSEQEGRRERGGVRH